MLPADRIDVRIEGGDAVPLWLGPEDHAWLGALVEDFARLAGRRHHEVAAFLQEPPRGASPAGKRRMALWMLEHICRYESAPVDAGALRDAVAVAAQRARAAGRFDRAEVLASVAPQLGLTATEADHHLFADLPGERRLRLPDPLPTAHALATRTNVALAQGLLRLASEVAIELYGGARPVVRQVHLRRLLCTARRVNGERVRLEISGAFSLFRHTTMYGRALASILPLVVWCNRFEVVARCMLAGRAVRVRLGPGDPIAVGEQPRAYDSRLEERFAREFTRANLDWDLVREPEPVEAGAALVFPDFAIVHRRDASRRFLLEIVGFWTPDYLRTKLERLRAMPGVPLVLCIDRGLNCSREELPSHARVVWFRRTIDSQAVLAAIEAPVPEVATRTERIGLADLFIDWAGRQPPSDPAHRRLGALELGSPVRLVENGPWMSIEADGGPVAMLSAAARARWRAKLDRIIAAKVLEKVERRPAQSAPEWRGRLLCQRWIVPAVEVTLAAKADAPADSR